MSGQFLNLVIYILNTCNYFTFTCIRLADTFIQMSNTSDSSKEDEKC